MHYSRDYSSCGFNTREINFFPRKRNERDRRLGAFTNKDRSVRYTEDFFAVTTLFLTIPKEVTHDHLLPHFSQFGDVQDVRIHKRRSFSYGFVTFVQAESAAKALVPLLHMVNNCELKVMIADSWHQNEPVESQNSRDSGSGPSMSDDKLSIEVNNVTRTQLMDLNDDCLYKILSLKMISITDLCSVAEVNTHLKQISTQVFTAKHKIFNFKSMRKVTIYQFRRMLIHFGSFITELSFGPNIHKSDEYKTTSTRIMDLVIRYCDELKSLNLIDYAITEYLSARLQPLFKRLHSLRIESGTTTGSKSLFANCKSLVELKLNSFNRTSDMKLILDSTFPKLERFEYAGYYEKYVDELSSFIPRYKSLKTFSIEGRSGDGTTLFPIIAKNCKQLEVLRINGEKNTQGYDEALMNLLSLSHLKELRINCEKHNVTKFLNALHSLKSLDILQLWYAKVDSGFVPALSKLTSLRGLQLTYCDDLKSLKPLGSLVQLTELVFEGKLYDTLDVIDLITKLVNLKTLLVEMKTFQMDKMTYLKIVDIVRKRPSKQVLQITCYGTDNYIADIQSHKDNHQFVKIKEFCKTWSNPFHSEDNSNSFYIDSDDERRTDFKRFKSLLNMSIHPDIHPDDTATGHHSTNYSFY